MYAVHEIDSVKEIFQYIDKIPEAFYSLFIGISAFIENVFPPFPGDTVIVIGGTLVAAGKMDFVTMYLAVLTGNLLGALVMFYLGSHVIQFLRRLTGKSKLGEFLSPEYLKKSEEWFQKYGFWAVVFSRFSAGIRFFVAIVAGMSKMNVAAFVIAFTIATLLWNSLLIYGGYALGANWQTLIDILRVYNIFVMGGIAILVIAYFTVKKLRQHRKIKEKESKNV